MEHLAVVRNPELPPAGYLADLAGASMDSLVAFCAHAFGVSVADLVDYEKTHPLMEYRQVSMAAINELGGISFTRIGRAFSRRDHTTVLHACNKVASIPRLCALRDRLVADLHAYVLAEVGQST